MNGGSDRRYQKGAVVYMRDGRTLEFGTKAECARFIGVAQNRILAMQTSGRPDRFGNFYDWPLDRPAAQESAGS